MFNLKCSLVVRYNTKMFYTSEYIRQISEQQLAYYNSLLVVSNVEN